MLRAETNGHKEHMARTVQVNLEHRQEHAKIKSCSVQHKNSLKQTRESVLTLFILFHHLRYRPRQLFCQLATHLLRYLEAFSARCEGCARRSQIFDPCRNVPH